jgi:hypothetical protein
MKKSQNKKLIKRVKSQQTLIFLMLNWGQMRKDRFSRKHQVNYSMLQVY